MKPRIFIGSSVEGKTVADAIQMNLDYDAHCTVWDQAFPLSHSTIDSLLHNLANHDFAIFILSGDDKLKLRNEDFITARDNVVYEAGLAAGMYGKERCFLVVPRDIRDFHLPTDLLGLTKSDYDHNRVAENPLAALGATSGRIRQAIKSSLWLTINLVMRSKQTSGTTYPLKLFLNIKNDEPFPITLESIRFRLNNDFKVAPNERKYGNTDNYVPLFFISKDEKNTDVYKEYCTLKPNDTTYCWIPLDPKIGEDRLDQAIKNANCGEFHYRCIVHKEQLEIFSYRKNF